MSKKSASASESESASRASAGSAEPGCRVCSDFGRIAGGARFVGSKHDEAQSDGRSHARGSAPGTTAAAAASTTTKTASTPSLTVIETLPCPPDGPELGRATWTFLHTAAAYYAHAPTPAQQADMRQFITLFARIYPCGHCADHLRDHIERHPPPVGSARALSEWWCGTHNAVNRVLGKPEFDCARVMERWRDGRPECDGGM